MVPLNADTACRIACIVLLAAPVASARASAAVEPEQKQPDLQAHDRAPAPWPLQQLPVTLGGGGIGDSVVSLTSFGGVADGHTDNAPAFARALAQLGRNGGGTLVVPRRAAGSAEASTEAVYASMPILVNVSRVTLRLEEGTRLLALCNIGAWPTRSPWDSFPTVKPQMERYYAPFVHALNVTDFVLDGGGVIDGQGACWWAADCDYRNDPSCRGHLLPHERPRLVVIEGAQRVSLANFTATMSAFWTVVLFQTSDVHVRNVTVRNPSGGTGPCHSDPPVLPCYGSNADGIDLVSVTRALVEGMDVVAGDDCFCVKSGEDAPGRAVGMPSRDIRFRHNLARHCSNPHQFGGLADPSTGFKIGTEMSGGVFNVLVEDNAVGYAGQAVKVSTPVPRGGRVHNITFQRIEVARAGMILAVTDIVGPLPKSSAEAPQVSGITFRDIFVHNVSCLPGAVAYGCSQHNAGWFHSSPSKLYPLVNVTVRNVTGLAGDPANPLTWDCSEPGTVFGDAVDVTPPLTCLGRP